MPPGASPPQGTTVAESSGNKKIPPPQQIPEWQDKADGARGHTPPPPRPPYKSLVVPRAEINLKAPIHGFIQNHTHELMRKGQIGHGKPQTGGGLDGRIQPEGGSDDKAQTAPHSGRHPADGRSVPGEDSRSPSTHSATGYDRGGIAAGSLPPPAKAPPGSLPRRGGRAGGLPSAQAPQRGKAPTDACGTPQPPPAGTAP